MEKSPRVLSIQSHVVSGYVGNKSATFPLQILGFEVDFINSVQFSNHTGYKHWKGQVLESQDLDELFSGLKLNNLHRNYTHILTGYCRSASFLNKVYDIVKEIKEVNPNAIYVCDPVLGDFGKLYVPEELVPLYRDKLVPLSDIVTPNQFETELLTGIKIKNEADVFKAIDVLHSRKIPNVVISSSELGNETKLVAFGSTRLNGNRRAIRLEMERFENTFIGTGDLFAALLLAWHSKSGGDIKTACEKTISTLQDILKRTCNYLTVSSVEGEKDWASIELKLIQSKDDIESPKTHIIASELNI